MRAGASGPSARARAAAFCDAFGLRLPILMAPMAGASPPALAAAVAEAGGLGGCGCLGMSPAQIADWSGALRRATNGAFQLNTWVPEPAPPLRDPALEARMRGHLARFGPEVPEEAAEAVGETFEAEMAAILSAGPAVVSTIMGLLPEPMRAEVKARGIRWLANVTSVSEAEAAAAAGADALVVQGIEAGGHRGVFDARDGSAGAGLMALLPAVADTVPLPLIAAGGIADGRTIAAALTLGASAVQIGTGLLRTPEAAIAPAWADAIARARPEDTVPTRLFSGRIGRALRTGFTEAEDAPPAAAYPVQRGLTGPMRATAAQSGDLNGMSAWAGQSARLASDAPAAALVSRLWEEAQRLLPEEE